MKTTDIIKGILASAFVVLVYSCGIPKVTTKENSVNLPSSYANNSVDSTSVAQLKWKDFLMMRT
ncbi:hypothetical protein [Flavobacterium haoranii]|uniref:hypothetical protein n=1 Tax=Flavobacterium haoranii TaxID=683124 RepID=UPI001D0F43A0|nr:hypothetical protein [Flavobacterium haoranii]